MGRGTKQLDTDTAEQMEQKSKGSKSGQEPTKEPAEYFDPLTGNTIEGGSLADLSDKMAAAGVPPLTREALRQRHGQAGFNAQALLIPQARTKREKEGKPDEEWEVFSIDLSRYPDTATQQRARRIVIDAISHPDFQWQKPQAGDKKPTVYTVKGWRAVKASGIHSEQAGAEAHFHINAHVNVMAPGGQQVLNGKHPIGSNDQVYAAVAKQVNDALDKAGLAPLEWLAPNRKAGNDENRAATEADAHRLAKGEELDGEEMAPQSFDPHTEAVRFDTQADAAMREAAQARKAYEEAAARAGMLQKAVAAVKDAEFLRERLAAEGEAKAKAEAQTRAAEAEAEEARKHADALMENALRQQEAIDEAKAEAQQAQAQALEVAEAVGVAEDWQAGEIDLAEIIREEKAATAEEYARRLETARETAEEFGIECGADAGADEIAGRLREHLREIRDEAERTKASLEQESRRAAEAEKTAAAAKAEQERARAEIEDKAKKIEAAGFGNLDDLIKDRKDQAENAALFKNQHDRTITALQKAGAASVDDLAAQRDNQGERAKSLIMELAEEKAGRSADRDDFRKMIDDMRQDMKREREEFAKRMEEERNEKSRLAQMVEKLQEQVEKWKTQAHEAMEAWKAQLSANAGKPATAKKPGEGENPTTPKTPRGGGGQGGRK